MLQWQNGSLVTRVAGGVHDQPRQVDPARPLGPAEVARLPRRRAPTRPPVRRGARDALPGAGAAPGRPRHLTCTSIPQLIVSTLLLGGIYALIAVGLTLIFGVMRVVNFAHGEFLMLGMYLAFWAFALLALRPVPDARRVAAALVRRRAGRAIARVMRPDRPRLAQRAGVHHGRAVDRAAEPGARAVDRRRPLRAHGLLRGRRADRRRRVQRGADRRVRRRRRRSPPGSSPSCAGRTPARSCARPRRTGTPRRSWASTPTASTRSPGRWASPASARPACCWRRSTPSTRPPGLQFVLIAYVAVVLGGLGDMARRADRRAHRRRGRGGRLLHRSARRGRKCSTCCCSSPSSSCGRPGSSASAAPRRSAREGDRGRPSSSSPPPASRPLVVRDAFLLDSLVLILLWGTRRGGLERGRRLRRPDLARPLRVLRARRLRRGALRSRAGACRRGSASLVGAVLAIADRARHRLPVEPPARPVLRARDDRVLAGAADRRQPLARLHRRLRGHPRPVPSRVLDPRHRGQAGVGLDRARPRACSPISSSSTSSGRAAATSWWRCARTRTRRSRSACPRGG